MIKTITENNYLAIKQNQNNQQIFIKEKYKGVVILPVDFEGNILLLKHKRYVEKEPMLELPRGIVNDDEIYVQGALRELYEETNVKASEEDVEELGRLHADSGFLNDDTMVIVVNVKDFGDVKCNDKNENIVGHEVVNISEFADLIHKNEITDSFTLATFSLYIAEDYLY